MTRIITVVSLFLVCCIQGCTSLSTNKSVEVRTVVETVEVTRIVTQVAYNTEKANNPLPTQTNTLSQFTATEVNDISNAGVVIVEYYTLINHKLYQEAFNLLSKTKPNLQTFEDYVAVIGMIESVEVLRVVPYNQWALENGRGSIIDNENEERYYVEIVGKGKGDMMGSSVSDSKQLLFIRMVRENRDWKIYSADTAPFR